MRACNASCSHSSSAAMAAYNLLNVSCKSHASSKHRRGTLEGNKVAPIGRAPTLPDLGGYLSSEPCWYCQSLTLSTRKSRCSANNLGGSSEAIHSDMLAIVNYSQRPREDGTQRFASHSSSATSTRSGGRHWEGGQSVTIAADLWPDQMGSSSVLGADVSAAAPGHQSVCSVGDRGVATK